MAKAKHIDTLTPDAFLKKASDVAHFYGFRPLPDLLERAAHRRRAKKEKVPTLKEKVTGCEELFIDAVQSYATKHLGVLSQPVLAYATDAELPKSKLRAAKQQQTGFALLMLGCERSIAEALVLETALAILADTGVTEPCVCVNSVGNRDSVSKFSREVTSYFRKNLHALPAPCRQAFKKDVFDALECVKKRAPAIAENVPKPMQFLTEDSRKHMREVLEYLETGGTDYEIDETLIGPRDCYSETLFEIRDRTLDDAEHDGEMRVFAHGGRFDDLGKKMYRSAIPAVGIVISHPKAPRKATALPEKRVKQPQVYFIQLGFNAKLQSFPIMEMLRKAKISVYQSLSEDRLGAQVEAAEQCGAAYTVLIGQKEALEKVAIVRDMETRAQETVPIDALVNYLKKKLKGTQ